MTSPFVIGSNFYHGRCNRRMRGFALSQAGAATADVYQSSCGPHPRAPSPEVLSPACSPDPLVNKDSSFVMSTREGKILFAICAAAAAAIFTAAATALSGATSELLVALQN